MPVFQAILETAGRDVDFLACRAGSHHGYLTGIQAFRENAIVAGGIKPLARVDFLFVLHVLDLAGALVALPSKSAVHAAVLRNHTGGKRSSSAGKLRLNVTLRTYFRTT